MRSRVVSGVAANPKGRKEEGEEEVVVAAASLEVRTGMGEMRW